MTTVPDVEALAREITQRTRCNWADALSEAKIEVSYQRGLAVQAAAAQREATAPPQGFTWERYDDIDRRATAQMDAALDPQRIAIKEATRARIEAQMRSLRQQRDDIDQRLAALEKEWRDNL